MNLTFGDELPYKLTIFINKSRTLKEICRVPEYINCVVFDPVTLTEAKKRNAFRRLGISGKNDRNLVTLSVINSRFSMSILDNNLTDDIYCGYDGFRRYVPIELHHEQIDAVKMNGPAIIHLDSVVFFRLISKLGNVVSGQVSGSFKLSRMSIMGSFTEIVLDSQESDAQKNLLRISKIINDSRKTLKFIPGYSYVDKELSEEYIYLGEMREVVVPSSYNRSFNLINFDNLNRFRDREFYNRVNVFAPESIYNGRVGNTTDNLDVSVYKLLDGLSDGYDGVLKLYPITKRLHKVRKVTDITQQYDFNEILKDASYKKVTSVWKDSCSSVNSLAEGFSLLCLDKIKKENPDLLSSFGEKIFEEIKASDDCLISSIKSGLNENRGVTWKELRPNGAYKILLGRTRFWTSVTLIKSNMFGEEVREKFDKFFDNIKIKSDKFFDNIKIK